MRVTDRIKNAWNAFTSDERKRQGSYSYGSGSSNAKHRTYNTYNSNGYLDAIFNRIALDTSMTEIHHVKIDAKTEDRTTINSGVHQCLNIEANIDQSGVQFIQDLVYSMFDEGVVAAVPVDTDLSPTEHSSYEVYTMRVGKIRQWYPDHVTVALYNDRWGRIEEVTVPKRTVAIIENPLYAVTTNRNVSLSRLLKKMSILDSMDDESVSDKLNMFIQLPYAVKTDLQRAQAEERLTKLEQQLMKSRYGIAYIDATEKITPLTKPLNASLAEEVSKMQTDYLNQLGLTQNVLNGTATQQEMSTYYSRTIDPIVAAITKEFDRKFLTKTARTQGHKFESYRNPFLHASLDDLTKIGDTLRRNYIASPNEVRRILGLKNSNDPRADELFNPNIADKNQTANNPGSLTSPEEDSSSIQNG